MPLPPRDFSEYHTDMGIRRNVALLAPMAKFVPPYALLALQHLRDSGTPLVLHLDEESWMTLACLDETSASYVIQYSLPYAANRKLANTTLRAAAAPFLGPMVVMPAPAPAAPQYQSATAQYGYPTPAAAQQYQSATAQYGYPTPAAAQYQSPAAAQQYRHPPTHLPRLYAPKAVRPALFVPPPPPVTPVVLPPVSPLDVPPPPPPPPAGPPPPVSSGLGLPAAPLFLPTAPSSSGEGDSCGSGSPKTVLTAAVQTTLGMLGVKNAICEAIQLSGGTVTRETFRPHAQQLDGLGPGLAAKAVREFMRADGWRQNPEAAARALQCVLCKYTA